MIQSFFQCQVTAVFLHVIYNTACQRGYTNNNILPKWGTHEMQHTHTLAASQQSKFNHLTANPRVHYCMKRHINTNFNYNLNYNP